jgi:hypothetical protein
VLQHQVICITTVRKGDAGQRRPEVGAVQDHAMASIAAASLRAVDELVSSWPAHRRRSIPTAEPASSYIESITCNA